MVMSISLKASCKCHICTDEKLWFDLVVLLGKTERETTIVHQKLRFIKHYHLFAIALLTPGTDVRLMERNYTHFILDFVTC